MLSERLIIWIIIFRRQSVNPEKERPLKRARKESGKYSSLAFYLSMNDQKNFLTMISTKSVLV